MTVTVNKETQTKRLEICGKCEHMKGRWLWLFNAQSCGVCKCNLKAKTKMHKCWGGKCPIDKW